ncbi:hypothetical protein [Streptomyces nigrescens]|uniref:Uncharacterized protein n=1 Tax=Streptomyces nigrescens TaxID=1920 RepID=A0ABY7JGC8_STRNI|nr:hypothetical protein [Streptomyces nigrescens]WAU08989.1 hypothetical protein STRNI_007744 [Streptomyces nigrescens]
MPRTVAGGAALIAVAALALIALIGLILVGLALLTSPHLRCTGEVSAPP